MAAAANILLCSSLLRCCSDWPHLQLVDTYNIDPRHISISGFSSGGYMTVQMHLSHSSLFVGAGVVAGGPYHYASMVEETTFPALGNPEIIDVAKIQTSARELAASGRIDPVENLKSAKVFVLAESLDGVIVPEVVEKTYQFYRGFVDPPNLWIEYVESVHSFPTMNYGGVCDAENPMLINNCSYNAAYKILNHIEENIVEPNFTLNNRTMNLIRFNISQSVAGVRNLTDIGMDEIAYMYVPGACEARNVSCKLHVALHGCTQGASTIGEAYVRHTGYNEVAAANRMIVFYPQAKVIPVINPFGCWDWMGSTGPEYASKRGAQIETLIKIIEHIADMKVH